MLQHTKESEQEKGAGEVYARSRARDKSNNVQQMTKWLDRYDKKFGRPALAMHARNRTEVSMRKSEEKKGRKKERRATKTRWHFWRTRIPPVCRKPPDISSLGQEPGRGIPLAKRRSHYDRFVVSTLEKGCVHCLNTVQWWVPVFRVFRCLGSTKTCLAVLPFADLLLHHVGRL